jgi:hypothetical protein
MKKLQKKQLRKIFFQINFSITKYLLSLIAAMFLLLTFFYYYNLINVKISGKYKFIVSVSHNSSNLLFEQHLNLSPFFVFENSLKNLVPDDNKNIIKLDLISFEIFIKNLSEISANSSFLAKEKINWKKENNIIIFEKINHNERVKDAKKIYYETNIQSLIDGAINETYNNIYDLYSFNYKKNSNNKNFRFIEKDELVKIINKIIKIEIKFQSEEIDKRFKVYFQYFMIILFTHLILFIFFYNFRKTVSFYYSKINLD